MSEPITNEQLQQALRFPESDFRRQIAAELLAARECLQYVTKQLIACGVDCGAAPVEELARRAQRRIAELDADRERLLWVYNNAPNSKNLTPDQMRASIDAAMKSHE